MAVMMQQQREAAAMQMFAANMQNTAAQIQQAANNQAIIQTQQMANDQARLNAISSFAHRNNTGYELRQINSNLETLNTRLLFLQR